MQLSICKLLLVKEHCLLILHSYPNEFAVPTVLSCADIQSPHVFRFPQSEGGMAQSPLKDALAVAISDKLISPTEFTTFTFLII